MGFFFTQLFITFSLLTPGAFGLGENDLRFVLLLGILAGIIGLAYMPGAPVMRFHQPYLLIAWVLVTALSVVPIYVSGAVVALHDEMPFAMACMLLMLTVRRLGYLTSMAYLLWALCSFVICMGLYDMHTGMIGRYLFLESVHEVGSSGDLSTFTYRIMGLGTIHDPNDFGQLLVTTIPLLGLRWKRGATAANLVLTVLPAAFLIFGIYNTRSRGTTLALLVLLFFLFKDRLGIIGSSLLGIGAVAGLVGLGLTAGRGMAEDDGSRVTLWAECFEAFRHHPILGVGWGNAPDYTDTHLTAHNTFVVDFTETGLVGYFIFIAILVSCWYTTTNMIKYWEERNKEKDGAETKLAFPWSRPVQPRPAIATPALAAGGAMTLPEFFPPAVKKTATASVSGLQTAQALGGTPGAPKPFMKFGAPPRPEEPLEVYAHAAFCLRLSLIALLTSGMFLSRAYSLPIYILIGLIAAFAAMCPVPISPPIKKVFKTTPVVMFLSILAIYLFIRLHGGR